jgi:GNAT superfamily N-acetyltransferase
MTSARRERSSSRIGIARTPAQIRRCHAVMRELRPQVQAAQTFVQRIRRQQRQGYLLAFVEAEGEIRAVAGYRYLESLFSGKFLYVDDLVTSESARSQGWGGALLDWLLEQAAAQGCDQLELDSGVQRFDAHRFYFTRRMKIASYHFSIKTNGTDRAKVRKRK